MSLFRRPPAKKQRTAADWVSLSLMTEMPKPTGDPCLDMHNDAISLAQAYLNGRASVAENDDDRELILRLRASLNFLHIKPEYLAPIDTTTEGPTP